MSPTQRSLKLMRSRGYTAAVTERWNPHAKIRQDLFGFIDIVAVSPDVHGVTAVQACGSGGMSSHRKKIAGIEAARVWLRSGNHLLVQEWVRRPPLKGKARLRIELREHLVTMDELGPVEQVSTV